MCHLKVVLLVSGRGADSDSYKPDRDETQWWSRRDALVRTVAAFLFGPDPNDMRRELILLFDEDNARMSMSFDRSKERIVPSEKEVITLWKKASLSLQNGSSNVSRGGLTCVLQSETLASPQNSRIESMNKRQLLELVQKSCSMDFLREHKLNCSLPVALKKVNQKSLIKTWQTWQQQLKGSEGKACSNKIQQIFRDFLKKRDGIKNVIAATLHESSMAELPYWNKKCRHSKSTEVCFFLGAVRDMSRKENLALIEVCQKENITLLKVRLGPVAEFTSKILTIVAYHHNRGVLLPAMEALAKAKEEKKASKRRYEKSIDQPLVLKDTLPASFIHYVVFVPIKSSELTLDLDSRNRAMWCLVRCIVTSLWRSRLASSDESLIPVQTSLILRFQDNEWLKLGCDGLVKSMAEKHQAAPSEHQILKAVNQEIQKAALSKSSNLSSVLDTLISKNTGAESFALDLMHDHHGCNNASDYFLSIEPNMYHQEQKVYNAFVLMNIGETSLGLEGPKKQLHETMRKAKVSIIPCSVVNSRCEDKEAATITLLQQFAYQNQLLGFYYDYIGSKQPK